jgi:hypothetical protein
MADDVDVEAQWYEEIGALLVTAGGQYRRFAGLLRLARGNLPPDELEAERLECRRLTYRLGKILLAEESRAGDRKGSVKE